MSRTYHNDHDAYCCAWTRSLMAAGEIPEGVVDERPIEEVTPEDVRGYDVCHWFAGIAGRSAELAPSGRGLAGWDDYRRIPCRDGKHRRVGAQPGDEPLAARLPSLVGFTGTESERVALVAAKANRVGRLRGYGNAVSPPVTAAFVRAFMAAVEDLR